MSENIVDPQAMAFERPLTRRAMLKLGVQGGAGLVGISAAASFLAACGTSPAPTGGANPLSSGNAIAMSTLIANAKKEGRLNTIALPPDWANYGALLAAFPKKYGVPINNESPDDSSGQEVQAITSYRNNKNLEPDAVDVGPSFAQVGKQKGPWAPYRNANWDTIPARLKDPE